MSHFSAATTQEQRAYARLAVERDSEISGMVFVRRLILGDVTHGADAVEN